MGTTYHISPIPPVEENTVRFPAGVVTFGLEMRELNPAIVDAFFTDRPDQDAVLGLLAEREDLDDEGASIHVFGTEDQLEYLRFDCFEKEPHYHYVHPHEEFQVVTEIDVIALGNPFEWAVARLRQRLPEMLRESGGGAIADRLDHAVVESALRDLIELKKSGRTGATA